MGADVRQDLHALPRSLPPLTQAPVRVAARVEHPAGRAATHHRRRAAPDGRPSGPRVGPRAARAASRGSTSIGRCQPIAPRFGPTPPVDRSPPSLAQRLARVAAATETLQVRPVERARVVLADRDDVIGREVPCWVSGPAEPGACPAMLPDPRLAEAARQLPPAVGPMDRARGRAPEP